MCAVLLSSRRCKDDLKAPGLCTVTLYSGVTLQGGKSMGGKLTAAQRCRLEMIPVCPKFCPLYFLLLLLLSLGLLVISVEVTPMTHCVK